MADFIDCEALKAEFEKYINKQLLEPDLSHLKNKLNSNMDYWKCWNRFRWERAQNSIDMGELADYLGPNFIWGFDSSWALAHEWNSETRNSADQIEAFYRDNKNYLYNLVIWEASGQRPDYVGATAELLDELNVSTICDFGCGVGTDGLKFLRLGKDVIFCDINNACLEFVRWRLRWRGLIARVYDPDGIGDSLFDTLWIMDVIEHLASPIDQILAHALSTAKVLIYDSEATDLADGRHPFHIEHSEKYVNGVWEKFGFVPYKKLSTLNILSKQII
jgi:SAM-dependent methyltransferase